MRIRLFEIRVCKNGLDHRIKYCDLKSEVKRVLEYIWSNRPQLFAYYQYKEKKVRDR